jgi:hypothetical protein
MVLRAEMWLWHWVRHLRHTSIVVFGVICIAIDNDCRWRRSC